jgi:hypothetical protein
MGEINEHDMTRNMLDRMRGIHNNQMINESVDKTTTKQSQTLDEHDMTKNMLYTLRGTQVINEVNHKTGSLINESFDNDDDAIPVENDELGEEAKKLREMVGGVDLKLYEVYPKDKNVVMVGILDNGIEFKFSKKEQAPYVNVDNLRLDIQAVDVFKKLQAYYVNWTQYWAENISEYTRSL